MTTISLTGNYGVHEFKNALKQKSNQNAKSKKGKNQGEMNTTLRGVLMNTYIKDKEYSKSTDMDEICNSLLIPDDFEKKPVYYSKVEEANKKHSLLRSALPYAASALLATGMALTVSNSYLKSQKLLKPGNVPDGIKLPVVGKNINLHSEEYFAIYMAICEPKAKNVLALMGVFAMSALTYAGKVCVDGVKKVWLKKQEADVKKNFEEQSIEIETKTFSGKLDAVREELVEKTKYFKEKLDSLPPSETSKQNETLNSSKFSQKSLYGPFLTFGGNEMKLSSINKSFIENNSTPAPSSEKENKLSFKEKFKNCCDKAKDSPLALVGLTLATIGIMALAGRKIFSNMGKVARIKENALSSTQEKIRESLNATINDIKNSDPSSREAHIGKLKEKLFSIGAEPEEIAETLKSAEITGEEAEKLKNEIVKGVAEAKFGKGFYVQADPAMGGKEGTQFYIYIDQAKGYIYDVITHPENKFARYLLAAITTTGATGYLSKEALDAVKEAAVIKENSETELDLQRRLVDTEIRNFKSKKQSAIGPLMADFDMKYNEGKPREELKAMAENILLEIKNGPPFVYD